MLTLFARTGLAATLAAVFSLPSYVSTLPAYSADRAQVGIAKYYSLGLFSRVAANRRMALRQDVDGYAAVPDCSRIGQVVRASINGHAVERYHVLDCSAPRDLPRHRRDGLVIEVDYASALRNGFVGLGRAPAVVYYP